MDETSDFEGAVAPDVYGNAAALYVSLLKGGYLDEATEFSEWFLETFDLDLET